MRQILLLCCCLALTNPAYALRCGTAVVSEGDSTMNLLRFCGQPTMKERQDRRILTRSYDAVRGIYVDDYVTVPSEIWTYNFGPRRFVQRITIEDGKIKQIESAGYGY
ncbi:MAG: DUF2845 domain-containing protein [Thiohalocapsa sp.]|uniref:DUF2845 domain-containing protein n=1 Tax=Thiohalocapsa sp. TaxID=2497641 RepID=UPI0025D2C01F|nr:DUF2845 domain-containing protein [Thiohalocapsa sp.]MCG6940350.1 DUF2845 domain-containing protein [Thiohalocapsa sp.]